MPSSKATERLTFWGSIVLAVLVCIVFMPFLPHLWRGLVAVIDVRKWSRLTWFLANVAALAVVLAIRFGPSVKQWWRTRRDKSV